MNIYNIVSDMNVGNGETKRTKCPNCGERTFTVTNNMGSLVWNCFRMSCGLKGGNRVRLSAEDIRVSLTGVREYAEETFVLPDYIVPHAGRHSVLQWCSRWGIDADRLGLMYDVKEDRVVFPVRQGGDIVDATGRALSKRLPKWKRYGKSGLPYATGSGKVAVVVEDCVSAAVVGYGSFIGVALLGTSLQDTHKEYLMQFSTAIVALDPDALPKTLQMAKELRGHVNDVRVLRLSDDLKYRNPEDMENLNGIIAS